MVALPGPLVEPAWLRAHLGEPGLVVVDCRYVLGQPGAGRPKWLEGHIPGAAFVDVDRDLAAEPGDRGRHPLPEAADFEAAANRAGIRATSRVVAYDEAGEGGAARLWWLLRHFGHSEAAVLHGGLAAWREEGGPLEAAEDEGPQPQSTSAEAGGAAKSAAQPQPAADAAAQRQPASADPGAAAQRQPASADPGAAPGAAASPDALRPDPFIAKGREDDTVDAPELSAALRGAGGRPEQPRASTPRLLDARAPERYRGETEPFDPVAGHIPGARNVPFADLAPQGRFPPPHELRERLGDQPFVAYCGSGITACTLVLAAELAGVEARLYPGSWSEWSRRGLPVETGD